MNLDIAPYIETFTQKKRSPSLLYDMKTALISNGQHELFELQEIKCHFTKQNYKRIRFHIEFGPPSLFERVRFKMKDVTTLYMDGVHFQTRASERNIPDDIMARLLQFDINEWRVVTASVREDRGKFVDSTWEIVIDGVRYWVTIGMGTFIKTIVIKETSGVESCIRSSEHYDLVEQINRKLMMRIRCWQIINREASIIPQRK